MTEKTPDRLAEGSTSTGESSQSVNSYDLYLGASRSTQDARILRLDGTADHDAIAYRLMTMSDLMRRLLLERGEVNLVAELDRENEPSGLAGGRSLRLD